MSRSSAFGPALTATGVADGGHPVAVQPHGLLLVLREPRLRVVQASTSAGTMLQRPLDTLLLATLHDLGGDAEARVRELLAQGPLTVPQPLSCTLGNGATAVLFEGALHRTASDTLVIELEPLATEVPMADWDGAALMAQLSNAVQRFSETASVVALAAAAARCVRELTGYDRVVVSEFGPDGAGQVIAEALDPRLTPLLGAHDTVAEPTLRARETYLRQRLRVVVDAQAAPSELLPSLAPGSEGDLDLAHCFLRCVPAAHARHLRDQGVAASLVVALAREGRLWGLITCHHARPRTVRYGLRASLELLAEVFSTRVAAIENYARAQVAAEVRRLEQRLVEATSTEGDWRAALFRNRRTLLQPLEASGALLRHEGQTLRCGLVPEGEALQGLLLWLEQQDGTYAPVQCAALGRTDKRLAPLRATASGVLAVRLSATQPDWLVWLRGEHENTGTAVPWTSGDIALAEAFGGALVDMILQVNAVRLLIAESQLAQVRASVAASQEAVVVADTAQRTFYANAAFYALAGRRRDEIAGLSGLAGLFTEPDMAHRMIGQVRAEQRPWRGELALRRPDGAALPVALRAEPVPASNNTLLGTIFIFEDLSAAKLADAAREQLESLLSRTGHEPQTPDGQQLVGAIITNASLAAMDIAEGGDAPKVAPLLQEVQASTARATSLLAQIRRFSGRAD